VPPPAVGKTGILLFQSQLGDTIISSCTITVGKKCKLCRKCLLRVSYSTSVHHREIKPPMSHCFLHSIMTSMRVSFAPYSVYNHSID
jgi:hypothetical protein